VKDAPTDPSEIHPANVPATESPAALKRAAERCTACPLYRNATQVVFGEGPRHPLLILVGEQPGDQEDLSGHPFVGPAGRILDQALAEVGIDRSAAYVTNAVKHFKWEAHGKRRLHKKPGAREIAACRPWLDAEIRVLQPRVIVCLGATAVRSVLGPGVRVLRDRGKVIPSEYEAPALVTVHPSSLLRAPDAESRQRAYADFIRDLRLVADRIRE
jgi:DNA polymerase